MYDHIGLRVGNLDASVRFYTAALAPLGFVLCSRDDSGAGFGPKGAPALWLHLHKGSAGSAAHVAFRAKDHAAIKQFHAEGLKAGGRDNGGAGPRADYSPTYLRGVPDRSRRQQCRGGLYVTRDVTASDVAWAKRSVPHQSRASNPRIDGGHGATRLCPP